MKHLFIILALAIGFAIPVSAYADTPTPVAPSASAVQAISPEETAKLREQIQALSKALGNEDPKPAEAAKPAEAPKSVSEVASKAIDMMGNGANKVIDMIGSAVGTLSANLAKIAPEVWRIMIMQQYSKGITLIVVPTLLLLFTVIFTLIARKTLPPNPKWDEHWDQGDCFRFWARVVIPTVLLAFFSVWFVANMEDAIKYLINPEYYAIKDILQLIVNPGGTVSAP